MGQKSLNVYKKLALNTVIFAIGSFSSKLLVLLLMPIYTNALSTAEYGTVDLIIQFSNLILPIITLSISDSIIRFGLEKNSDKSKVLSIGVFTILIGFIVFLIAMPLVSLYSDVNDHLLLLYLYVVAAAIKLLFSEFVRAKGAIMLYSFNGLLTTFSMITLNIIFLLVFKLGINGYLLAIILSDLISSVFLFFVSKLWKNIKLSKIDSSLWKEMLRFSIPLIPTTLLWWITNVSDRFMISYFIDKSATGLLATAYKLPTIVTALYAMFAQAWNMSAIEENDSEGKSRFYSNVFRSNSSVVFLIAAGVLTVVIPATKILVSPQYFISYLYTPYLVVAAVFTCFTNFLSGIYVATKKTKHSLFTSLIGAVVNVVLNLLLIPKFGINGATFATLVSYVVVFVLRMADVGKLSPFKYDKINLIANSFVLMIMSLAFFVADGLMLYIILGLGLLESCLLNSDGIMKILQKLVPERILTKLHIIK